MLCLFTFLFCYFACLYCMFILWLFHFAFDKVLLKNFTTTTTSFFARYLKTMYQTWHNKSWKSTYFGVNRSKVKVTSYEWVFALLWVLVSSSCIRCTHVSLIFIEQQQSKDRQWNTVWFAVLALLYGIAQCCWDWLQLYWNRTKHPVVIIIIKTKTGFSFSLL